ncbi:ABC transporter permease [uncultured Maritimibacter sp.]|jgi:ribose transport system permease protein|uniref:ABC transporter permease n=1 Tax=uncultured Maritimibacter sp. TaxID=991866 RepID=UPI000AD564FA|nr:ABC transporter permease [uncultured Maritimibacter sp.]
MTAQNTDMPVVDAPRINIAEVAEKYALVAALVVLFGIFAMLLPNTFFTWANVSTMLGSQSVLVFLTLALIIPLTSGDFDLSVAATLTISAMTLAVLNARLGVALPLAMLGAFAVGGIVGVLNAFFILYFRIPSLIVTLGIGTFLNGLTLWMSNSATIGGIDFALVMGVVGTRLFGIPLAFYYAILMAAVIWYVFGYTSVGRRLLFVGRGREVARLSGIQVDRVRFFSLLSSSLIAALAGILYAGTIGAADPNSGNTFLLPAFAAAFLGATAITPGRFNPVGSVVAVYFIVIGITGLTMLGIQSFVQNLFYGGALVLAVALSQLVRKREEQQVG